MNFRFLIIQDFTGNYSESNLRKREVAGKIWLLNGRSKLVMASLVVQQQEQINIAAKCLAKRIKKRAEQQRRFANRHLATLGDRIWYKAARRWIETNLEEPEKDFAFGLVMSGKLQFWIGKQVVGTQPTLLRPRRYFSEHVESAIGQIGITYGHARAENLVTYLLDTLVKNRLLAYIDAIIADYGKKWKYSISGPKDVTDMSEMVTDLAGNTWELESKNKEVSEYEAQYGKYRGQGKSLTAAKLDAFFNYYFD